MTDRTARVTVITGGGTGIGAATARLLSGRGEHVVIAGRRREPLTAVAHDCGALPVVADVATPRGVDDLVAAALGAFGRIDGVVLNAGVDKPGEVAQLSQADWEESLRINLTAPFLLAQAALPSLTRSRGSLVGVSPVAAIRTGPGAAAYSAAKAGLESLTRSIAFEHAAHGVRANCVSPGWTRTFVSDRTSAPSAAC
jgi:NAD(P)-dependent dehydrogenase (short-subunit alcohol dehydrogenase family)